MGRDRRVPPRALGLTEPKNVVRGGRVALEITNRRGQESTFIYGNDANAKTSVISSLAVP